MEGAAGGRWASKYASGEMDGGAAPGTFVVVVVEYTHASFLSIVTLVSSIPICYRRRGLSTTSRFCTRRGDEERSADAGCRT
jgi:hypothetical protein